MTRYLQGLPPLTKSVHSYRSQGYCRLQVAACRDAYCLQSEMPQESTWYAHELPMDIIYIVKFVGAVDVEVVWGFPDKDRQSRRISAAVGPHITGPSTG